MKKLALFVMVALIPTQSHALGQKTPKRTDFLAGKRTTPDQLVRLTGDEGGTAMTLRLDDLVDFKIKFKWRF